MTFRVACMVLGWMVQMKGYEPADRYWVPFTGYAAGDRGTAKQRLAVRSVALAVALWVLPPTVSCATVLPSCDKRAG
jgi:hypothetical protein